MKPSSGSPGLQWVGALPCDWRQKIARNEGHQSRYFECLALRGAGLRVCAEPGLDRFARLRTIYAGTARTLNGSPGRVASHELWAGVLKAQGRPSQQRVFRKLRILSLPNSSIPAPRALSGVKRTLLSKWAMSAFDPKRTWSGLKSRSAAVSCPYRGLPPRFRIIQVGPKDFLAPLRQVEAAVD